MGLMSTSTGGVARRLVDSPLHTSKHRHITPLTSRLLRALWLRERGAVELRWASITLVSMILLAVFGRALDPFDGEFDTILLVATPFAIGISLLAWTRIADRIGPLPVVRVGLGPLVLVVAAIGAGPADVTSLARSAAAPLIVLAMAFAAMTPGFPIAAAALAGTSIALFVAHWQIISAHPLANLATDDYAIGIIVTLLASTGMAIVVRVATEAEARATRLSASNRQRVDVLERVNRIVARFDGSKPVEDVIQAVVDDISREFQITLVSMYLPSAPTQLTMVGVAGYPSPFHVIDVGVGIIGRAAETQQTQFVPDVLADPDYRAARDDVRSEVAAPVVHSGELLGVVNFEGTLEHPIGTSQVALAEMIVHSLSAALRSARLDDERRDRLHAIERVLAVSRSLVADLDRPRIVTSIVDAVADLLAADLVVLFTRRVDGVYELEAGVGVRDGAIGSAAPPGSVLLERCVAERARVEGSLDARSWPIVVSRPAAPTGA